MKTKKQDALDQLMEMFFKKLGLDEDGQTKFLSEYNSWTPEKQLIFRHDYLHEGDSSERRELAMKAIIIVENKENILYERKSTKCYSEDLKTNDIVIGCIAPYRHMYGFIRQPIDDTQSSMNQFKDCFSKIVSLEAKARTLSKGIYKEEISDNYDSCIRIYIAYDTKNSKAGEYVAKLSNLAFECAKQNSVPIWNIYTTQMPESRKVIFDVSDSEPLEDGKFTRDLDYKFISTIEATKIIGELTELEL